MSAGARSPSPPSLRIGLTGGIATGKSVVASVFLEAGAHVLDADSLGHELMAPGTEAFEAIRLDFGAGILGADGAIDRRKLGAIVFADDAARRRLNAILHPRIMEEARRRMEAFLAAHPGSVALTQAALLVEAGATGDFDRIVLVDCDAQTQRRRLMQRDGITEEEARRRISTQAPAPERRAAAHLIIDTSGSLEETRARARLAFEDLLRERSASNKAS